MITTNPALIERIAPRVVLAGTARNGVSRTRATHALYAGAHGARNWLGVAHDPAYPLAGEDHFDLRANRLAVLEGLRVGTVISLGPGDGLPDIEPVAALTERSRRLRYIPVDISRALLDVTIEHLEPHVEIPVAVVADFETDHRQLEDVLARHARRPSLFMLIGGTMGNLEFGERAFFGGMRRLMRPGDLLLVDVPLAGPAWSADRDPRLDPAAYTEAFCTFLAGALSEMGLADDRPGFAAHFSDRVRLSLDEGLFPGARTITVADRWSGRRLLRFTRYDWDRTLRWFTGQGFSLVCAPSSLHDRTEPFGMGVALLTTS